MSKKQNQIYKYREQTVVPREEMAEDGQMDEGEGEIQTSSCGKKKS